MVKIAIAGGSGSEFLHSLVKIESAVVPTARQTLRKRL